VVQNTGLAFYTPNEKDDSDVFLEVFSLLDAQLTPIHGGYI